MLDSVGRGDVIDRVAAAMREVCAAVIEPRFEALNTADVEEKSPGEVVTVADREAEALLCTHLESILPDVPIVAEEACATDPARMRALTAERVWVVDPLDGTANFVAGSDAWAVMIALLSGGTTVASWIWQPLTRRMYVAEKGSGAECNGVTLRAQPRSVDSAALRGVVLTRFLDTATLAAVTQNRHRFADIVGGRGCSGVEYPALIGGESDFVLFWRTLPWDHAPGVLLLEEAGGSALRRDGSAYCPADDRAGLLGVADAATWPAARRILA